LSLDSTFTSSQVPLVMLQSIVVLLWLQITRMLIHWNLPYCNLLHSIDNSALTNLFHTAMFRLYNQLEEVKQRKAMEQRQHIYAQNREKRKEFEKVSFTFSLNMCILEHAVYYGSLQAIFSLMSRYLFCAAVWLDIFTARFSYASVVTGIVILSFCLSVTCMLCDETKELTADILTPHERVITLVLWHQKRLVGDVPFHLKFALKMTHPLWKMPTSINNCYNVWTVRPSEKCSVIANR